MKLTLLGVVALVGIAVVVLMLLVATTTAVGSEVVTNSQI